LPRQRSHPSEGVRVTVNSGNLALRVAGTLLPAEGHDDVAVFDGDRVHVRADRRSARARPLVMSNSQPCQAQRKIRPCRPYA
jgi:hypothetical protein